MALPALYISHGSPRLIIEDSAARDFLQGFAKSLPKPRAIVIATAHFGTSRPAVVGDAKPGMIYDFGGMPELRKLVYPAPGDPQVAIKVAGLWQAAGFAPAVVTGYGYDHGTWVPLMLLYPDADVPVVQISVQPHLGPAHHIALGKALASMRDENFLVIGSGSLTHNLHEFYSSDLPPRRAGAAMGRRIHRLGARQDRGRRQRRSRELPQARAACGRQSSDRRAPDAAVHRHRRRRSQRPAHPHSTRSGVISMDTYAFG